MPTHFPLTCQACGAPLDAARSDGVCAICLFDDALEQELNESFGGHELCGEIARGGMGVVYRAMQREPRREVALKTLRGAELDSPEAQARFRDEARTMAELEHPGILPIYQFGQHDGVLFFTMKLAAGGTLAEHTTDYAGQWKKIATLIANVADAVQFAHEHGVLHRDIKPGNILFDEEHHAFVSDFGLAKLAERADGGVTGSAAILGTPHYMAPEIAAHGLRAATVSTDVWSLGVVLHELLAQKRPFKSESMPALLREIAEREPDALSQSVPSDLRIIASKALAKDPARRYASARTLADDLRCWLEGLPITARLTPGAERLWLWMKRNPALGAVSVLALLAVAAAISSLAWGLERAKQEANNMAAARDQIATARDESQQQLRNALVQRATSGRIAAISGWRDSGLKALKQAAAIRGGVDVRSEAIAHLVGVDLSATGSLPVMKGSMGDVPAISASFDLFAYFAPNESEERFCDARGKAVGSPVKITFPVRQSPWRFAVTSVFDPTARWLVVERFRGGGADHGDVVLIDVAGRRVLGQWKDTNFGGFSADGELFALLFDRASMGLFHSADGRAVGSIVSTLTSGGTEGDQCTLYPSGDSSFVAYAQGNVVEIWNWRERSMKAKRQMGFVVRRMA